MMRIAHGTIVLAADGTKALLLRNEGDEKFTVLQTLSHEETENPPTRATGSDQPGRSFSSTDARRSGYTETDWHRQAEERFARRAVGLLAEEAANDGDAGLVILAPPRFLGQLRERLTKSLRDRLRAEIDKDFAHRDVDDIAQAIARHPEAAS